MSLSLFDARPACDHCHRHYDGPTWEAIGECSEERLDVCSECAHDFRHKRQRVSAR